MIDRNIFRVPEVRWVLLLSVVLSASLWYYLEQNDKFDMIYTNYWNYTTLSATLLGFSITAFTIFFAFPVNYKIELLTKNENYPLLFDAFLLAIYLLMIFLFISLVGMFIDIAVNSFIYLGFIFIMVWSLLCVGLTIWILKRVIDVSLSSR